MPLRFSRLCRALRAATLLTMALLAVLVVSGFFGLPMLHGALPRLDVGERAVLLLVKALPALGYLWALWSVQRALGELSAGRTFAPTVARAMRHMGIGVLAGALLQVFAVTNLLRVLLHGRGSYLYFDLSAIVLGVVGATLIMLATVVDRARELEAELDEIV